MRMGNTTFTISVPTDNEGYVLLRCPICEELFKLIPEDYRSDDVFCIYCPGCGITSDSYVTEDIIKLARAMAENYAMDTVMAGLKKLESKTKNVFVKSKIKNKPKRKNELPIQMSIEALREKNFMCCNKRAKIKPILGMSGCFCPYCGVMDDENE